MINNKQCRAVASTTRVLILILFFIFITSLCLDFECIIHVRAARWDPTGGSIVAVCRTHTHTRALYNILLYAPCLAEAVYRL